MLGVGKRKERKTEWKSVKEEKVKSERSVRINKLRFLSPPCSTSRALEDATHYPEVFAELLKDASWSLQDLKKLAGLNLLRVMRQVEEVRLGVELRGDVGMKVM